MQHEAFFGFAFEAFQPLHVVAGAERCRDQSLRLAAGKDRAAVSAWQHSSFNPDVAHFIKRARIRTPLLVDDLLAENPLAQRLVIMLQLFQTPSCRLPESPPAASS